MVMRMKQWRNLGAAALVALALPASVGLAQQASVNVTIKDHRFSPVELRAPANTPITITVKNLDTTPEEFESKHLRVEKIVAGNGAITLRIRPLEPGRYRFFGDYHEATAEGFLVVE
jgi:plastocyanin